MIESTNTQSGLACNLMAIDRAERTNHLMLVNRLLATAAIEANELPNGYAFRFSAEHYAQIVSFIGNERQCCAFFTFVLEVPAGCGPINLTITGPEGAKPILLEAMSAMPVEHRPASACAAGCC